MEQNRAIFCMPLLNILKERKLWVYLIWFKIVQFEDKNITASSS